MNTIRQLLARLVPAGLADAVVVGAALVGCGKEPGSAQTDLVDPAAPAAPAAPAVAAEPGAAARGAVAGAGRAPASAAAPGAGDPPAPAIEHDGQLVRRIVEAYEKVRLDLYEGDFRATKLDAIEVGSIASERRDEVYREMVDAARFVTQQRTIEGSRTAFATLSRTLWAVVADTPVVAGAARGYTCPGAGQERWLQIGAALPGNPYRGREAAACADELPVRR